MSGNRFDMALPSPYKEKWREAYRSDKDDSPRLSSYQPPEGEPVPFIYKSLEFSGGQSVDTSEYPFFGLWSNEALNHKPQTVTVHGYLRGVFYLQQRTVLVDALIIPTSDEKPGFFDHPLWGRIKVVVESYNITEAADENGQCEITLTLKRAGVPLETRARGLIPQELASPKDTALAIAKIFAKINAANRTLLQSFGVIKTQLLAVTSALQLPQTIINGITNEITSIANLIAQGVQSPMELAEAFVNAGFSIAAACCAVEDSGQTVDNHFSGEKNKRTAMLNFLSASAGTLPVEAATVREDETKKASENLYRAVSLCAACEIMMSMEDATRGQMDGYWALYTKLENSINLEDPNIYQAVTEMRSALSEKLRQSGIVRELKKTLDKPVPLLFLSHYLNCDDSLLRNMNLIEDSFLISGEVSYV
jgi:hypothetical protein